MAMTVAVTPERSTSSRELPSVVRRPETSLVAAVTVERTTSSQGFPSVVRRPCPSAPTSAPCETRWRFSSTGDVGSAHANLQRPSAEVIIIA